MFFSKFQFTIFLTLVLCGSMLLTSSVEAQTVHALLVIMDADGSIGDSVKVDGENIEKLLDDVKGVYQTHVKTLDSSAGETTLPNVLREIDALTPGPDDVVFFYFSGHGGMMSKTDRRTYLKLSDTQFLRDDLEAAVNRHNCRLKLIITDCCSNYMPGAEPKGYVPFFSVRGRESKVIVDLFGKHEGLLHITGATEGQYAWGIKRTGGLFTYALYEVIIGDSDHDEDEFVEWKEIFEIARKMTGEKWERHQFFRHSGPGIDPKQVTRQNPKSYSLPARRDGRHTPELTEELWVLSNTSNRMNVFLKTDKYEYRRDDLLTVTIRSDKDCYLTLLNWAPNGSFVRLFPNDYDSKNSLMGGKTYTFPPPNGNYDFAPGASGSERLKAIVVTDKSTSDKINQTFKSSENRGGFQITEGQPRFDVVARVVGQETKIARILENLDRDEWAEERKRIVVQ